MLKIKSLEFRELNIPFKISFSHASASRNETQSIWVTIKSECGLIGYGEGCPREYVTGESLESVKQFISTHKKAVIETIYDLDSLINWVAQHESEIDAQPAAWCAIELALLDIFAKYKKCSVESLLDIPITNTTFSYTAVLGNSKLPVFEQQVKLYNAMKFQDYKMKLSGDIENDNAKLNIINKNSNAPRIRVDANNLWHRKEDVINYMQVLNANIFAIEEPLKPEQYDDLSAIANGIGLRIILDESFKRQSQLMQIKDLSENWIVNVRVSKMGGLLRSLDTIKQAKKYNIPIIIGAHVGETSLLTRAGIIAAQLSGNSLLAQEGGFGTYLLKHDICDNPLQFNQKGKIELSDEKFMIPGIGIDIRDQ